MQVLGVEVGSTALAAFSTEVAEGSMVALEVEEAAMAEAVVVTDKTTESSAVKRSEPSKADIRSRLGM
jgi:hypothetical protein